MIAALIITVLGSAAGTTAWFALAYRDEAKQAANTVDYAYQLLASERAQRATLERKLAEAGR